MRVGLPLMRNVLTQLAKSVLMQLGLTAAVSATYAANQKTIYGSGDATLIISNKEMKDIMKIATSLEELRFLVKGKSENETKEQKGGFLSMLLGTLTAILLTNMSRGLGIIRASEETISLVRNFTAVLSFN